jgi:hypothetical protein
MSTSQTLWTVAAAFPSLTSWAEQRLKQRREFHPDLVVEALHSQACYNMCSRYSLLFVLDVWQSGARDLLPNPADREWSFLQAWWCWDEAHRIAALNWLAFPYLTGEPEALSDEEEVEGLTISSDHGIEDAGAIVAFPSLLEWARREHRVPLDTVAVFEALRGTTYRNPGTRFALLFLLDAWHGERQLLPEQADRQWSFLQAWQHWDPEHRDAALRWLGVRPEELLPALRHQLLRG